MSFKRYIIDEIISYDGSCIIPQAKDVEMGGVDPLKIIESHVYREIMNDYNVGYGIMSVGYVMVPLFPSEVVIFSLKIAPALCQKGYDVDIRPGLYDGKRMIYIIWNNKFYH